MRIPNIRNFVTSKVDYFRQSSWKGKVVGILCAVSFFYLIRCVAFRKKTPPKGPDSSSPSLAGRVSKKPPAPSKEPPKADLTYIKTAVEAPDFFKQSEFGTWLSVQMESFESWLTMAKDPIGQASYFLALKRLIPELKAHVEKLIPVFKAHPNIKTDDWEVFLKEFDAVADQKITATESCIKLKACLDKLQAWNGALQRKYQSKFMQQVEDFEKYPHYEFTNLQTQYFHYLGLRTKKDYSNLLSVEIDHPAKVGLSEMEDVDCLQLRAMLPSIERLRQLFCFLTITGDEKGLRPLINKEIDRCREVLKGSDNITDELKNGQAVKENVKLLRKLFGDLSRNFAEGLTLLNEIEQKDIARQLLLLRGYIHQQDHLAAWTPIKEMGFTRLALYAAAVETQTLKFFYQMGR